MQVEAIYNHGTLEFLKPVKFIHQRFPVRVEIAQQELSQPEVESLLSGPIFEAYPLSPQALSLAMQWWDNLLIPAPNWVNDDEGYVLTDKQNQYWDAFEFRARLYAEQGKLP